MKLTPRELEKLQMHRQTAEERKARGVNLTTLRLLAIFALSYELARDGKTVVELMQLGKQKC
ncbi:MAG: urease subunit gamma [Acutalibacteraceae bacterium]